MQAGDPIKFVSKGWGYEKWIANSPSYCGKLLFIAKGKKCSWHYHKIKDEVFYVQSGKIILKDIDQILKVLKKQAKKYKMTPCMGRSHGIHAEPVTFGLKLASFYEEFKRNKIRLKSAIEEAPKENPDKTFNIIEMSLLKIPISP